MFQRHSGSCGKVDWSQIDIMPKLYFCPYNRRHALDMVAAYSAGFSKRVLTAFSDIEAEADAASEAYFNERIDEVMGYAGPDILITRISKSVSMTLLRDTASVCTRTWSLCADRSRNSQWRGCTTFGNDY